LTIESLEQRALLANIIPSAVISSTPNGSDFNDSIELTNSSQSDAGIGTFWFAWVPGEDFLATSPISVSPPVGWSDQITHAGAGDGYAIQYTADSSAYYVQPGASLDFAFESADAPASINGNSVFYPTTPVENAFVYPQGPFSDAGHNFVVTPAPTLTSISVTPANPSLPKGETEQFTATGEFSNKTTQNLTSEVTWASATMSNATVSNAAGSQGLATGVSAGTSRISATFDGITGSTVLTVSPAALVSIALAPQNPRLPKGETEQFTAIGTFADGSIQTLTSQVTWSSATPGVATISNAAGSQGLATALAQGTSTISASLDGASGSTSFVVTPAVLLSVAVTPVNPSVSENQSEQFTATGTFSDESTLNLTSQADWSSSNTAIATISTTGLATGLATGTSTISAAVDGITASTLLTVTSPLVSITVTPANPNVPLGETEQFTATGTLGDGATENLTSQVTWASATTSVATVSNIAGSRGVATTQSAGTSSISATLDGITGSTLFTVSPAVLVSIAVAPQAPGVRPGQTEQFTAVGTFSNHTTENVTSQVTWASSNAAVATISAAGLATGKGTGAASIAAALDGITGSTAIKVTLPPPVTVTLVKQVLNKKHQVTEIVVTFSGGVNAMEAQETSMFRLVMAGKDHSFVAKNATVIKLSSAVYNGASDTITLIPKKAFSRSKPVQLTINGTPPSGLQDSFGRFIDGNRDGQPGSNAVAVLRS